METLDGIRTKLHELFSSRGLTLSVAESCTGGLLAHLITEIPGVSVYFHSSLVCYSYESKVKLLGLRRSFLKKHGTVSDETSRAMAEAVRNKTGTKVSLAVTGVAGPERVEGMDVGIVFIAASVEGATTSKGYKFDGPRGEVKQSAALAALHFLYEAASVLA